MRKLKIGVNLSRRLLFSTNTLRDKLLIVEDFLRIFKMFFKKGEEWYIDFPITGAIPNMFKKDGKDFNKNIVNMFLKPIKENGFNVSIHAPHIDERNIPDLNLCALKEKDRKQSIDYAKTTIKISKYMNAEYITFHPGFTYKGTKSMFRHEKVKEIAKNKLLESLNELVDFAEKENIVITLENMEPRYDIGYILVNPIEVKNIVEIVSSKFLKITYDTGHASLAATHYSFNQVSNFRKIMKHVVKIHISDNYGIPALDGKRDYRKGTGDLHLVPLLGLGDVPNEKILKLKRDTLIIYEIIPVEIKFRESLKKLKRLV